MKKLVLLFTGLLIGLTIVSAAEKTNTATSEGENLITRYRYAQPIQFVERGVEFLIFPDGSFDFNTNIEGQTFNNGYDDGYYRTTRSRRGSVNTTYGAPGTRVKYSRSRSRGVIVTHDNDGKVRRIGNVFINYNRYGQVKRLGSVYIRYNRQDLVSQIGGLRIKYNRRGHVVKITGYVNHWNQDCGICGGSSCSINHFENHGNGNSQWNDSNDWNDDDDFYYYKNGNKTKKVKKLKRKSFKKDD